MVKGRVPIKIRGHCEERSDEAIFLFLETARDSVDCFAPLRSARNDIFKSYETLVPPDEQDSFPMPGKFLVLEGPDGCGKSTLLEAVRRHLENQGVSATFVRDPGGTEIGQQLRQVLLNPENRDMGNMTELLLYVASRAQLVAEVIRPARARGEAIISDRYFISTLAYQGAEQWLAAGRLREIVALGVEDAVPDHVIILDVPVAVGLSRVGKDQDRIEAKGREFHEKVRRGYLDYAATAPPGTVTVVDATRPLAEVKTEVLEIVDAVLR